MADEIVDDWEQHEGDTSMPEYAVGYNRGWDEGTKQARAEVLAACMAALEKSRAFQQRQASAAQDRGDRELASSHERLEYCFAVALTVLRNVQPAAADLEALLEEARRGEWEPLESVLREIRDTAQVFGSNEGKGIFLGEIFTIADKALRKEKPRAEGKG